MQSKVINSNKCQLVPLLRYRCTYCVPFWNIPVEFSTRGSHICMDYVRVQIYIRYKADMLGSLEAEM